MNPIFGILLGLGGLIQGFLFIAVIIAGVIGLIKKDYRLFKKLGRYWLYILLAMFVLLLLYGLVTFIAKSS